MNAETTYAAALLECGWPTNFRPQGMAAYINKGQRIPDADAREWLSTANYMFDVCAWWRGNVLDHSVAVQLIRPRLVDDPIEFDSEEFTAWWVGYKKWLVETRNGKA